MVDCQDREHQQRDKVDEGLCQFAVSTLEQLLLCRLTLRLEQDCERTHEVQT
jgi:hypothetical protein